MRPLADLVVLDFSTLLPGPMATLLLAEAGAEVIKIERSGTGEDMRHFPGKWGRDSALFALLNRGKKSLALDLKLAVDRDRLLPLIAKADILVEQFRPGVMARLGLGYEALAAINPRLIYCSITGYGQTGPKADLPGHDLNYIGDSGLLSLGFGSAAAPVIPPALIADIAGGAYPAMMNILLALEQRRRSGKGCYLDIAMAENALPFQFWALGQGFGTGKWPGNGQDLLNGGSPRYRLYPAKDGRIVAVGALEQKFWDNFCELIALPAQFRQDRRDPEATAIAIGTILAGRPAAYWAEKFAGQDVCCSIVASVEEAVADPHFAARGLFARKVANEAGDVMPALPVPVVPAFRAPESEIVSAPELGAHNRAVLGE